MTAKTGRIRIAGCDPYRQSLVRRWFDRAAEEMYERPGADKGFSEEETRLLRLTVDAIADQFADGREVGA